MIASNIRSQDNEDGLLTYMESEYYDCLNIDHKKIEKLLRLDEEHWDGCVEEAEAEA